MKNERIEKQENNLNEAIKNIKEIEQTLEIYKNTQKKLKELSKYYGSKTWLKDLEDYESGKIKQNAGVLSEDAIYNLLLKNKEIAIKMIELGTKTIKEVG